jgi:uncharacterized membrane protein
VTALQGAALIAATLTMGLMAGVFGLYAHTVMPGLAKTGDRTFVEAFAAMDRAIINPLFMLWFLGALGFAAVAALLHLGEPAVLVPAAAAFLLYLAIVVITFAVHLPLNDALKAAADAEPGPVREAFDAARWVQWNIVRALLSTVAFGLLAWALIEYGRTVGA